MFRLSLSSHDEKEEVWVSLQMLGGFSMPQISLEAKQIRKKFRVFALVSKIRVSCLQKESDVGRLGKFFELKF